VSNLLKENTVLASYFGKNVGKEIDASHDLIKTEQRENFPFNDYLASERYVLYQNIEDFNQLPGNLHPYDSSLRKTVLGSSRYGTPYKTLGGILHENLNYLDFDPSAYSWEANQQMLDCAIGHNDEFILSTTERDYPSYEKYADSYLYKEIEYLKAFGYTVSTSPASDGYYRMVPP